MKPYRPIIVVAVDEVGGFGKNGTIPWYLPEDLEHFKMLTQGHICVMGRRTYTDILDARRIRDKNKGDVSSITEILRGRQSFVVTSDKDMETPGATKIEHPMDIMKHLSSDDERKIFVIGGKKMFIHALSWCDKIFMTVVKGTYDCDVFFPVDVLNKKWKIVSGQQTEKAYYVVYNHK